MDDSRDIIAPSHGLATGEGQTVVSATFANPQAVRYAIQELRDVGIPAEDVSLISRDEGQAPAYRASDVLPDMAVMPADSEEAAAANDRQRPVFTDMEVPPDEPLGGSERLGLSPDSDMAWRDQAGTNATAGDVGRAGLLVGLRELSVPGIGPLTAAGPLATALDGVAADGAAGGIIGALLTLGVPEEYAREYAAGIEQGHTFISVRTDKVSEELVERVLVANGGENVYCA